MRTLLRILVVILLPLFNINITYAQTNFWEEVNNGIYGGGVFTLAINKSGHIFAGTHRGGIYRSLDSGDNWSQVNNGLTTNAWVTSLDITDSGYVFTGTSSGIYLSTNNGDNWTVINTGLPDFTFVFALAINGAGHIFAGTDGNGMFRSTDNGDNWICQFSCHQQQRRHFCRNVQWRRVSLHRQRRQLEPN